MAPPDALPKTAFDHGSVVGSGLGRLRAKLSYTNIGFALRPAFSIAELRDIYVAALGYEVAATNCSGCCCAAACWRRRGDGATGPRGRPARDAAPLCDARLEVTDPFAVLKQPHGIA